MTEESEMVFVIKNFCRDADFSPEEELGWSQFSKVLSKYMWLEKIGEQVHFGNMFNISVIYTFQAYGRVLLIQA